MQRKTFMAITLVSATISVMSFFTACGSTPDSKSLSGTLPATSSSESNTSSPNSKTSSQPQPSSNTPVSVMSSSSIANTVSAQPSSSTSNDVVYWTPGSKDYYHTKDGDGHLEHSKEIDSGTESEAKALGKKEFTGNK